MKIRLSIVAVCVSIFCVWVQAQGDLLTVHKNANLRAGSSTSSAIIDRLKPGDELTALSMAQQNGFYRVRTEAGREGWVYRTLVHLEETDEEETPAPTIGVSDEIDDDWTKPAAKGSKLTGPAGTEPCPADGEAGGDVLTNRLKNRTDVPTQYHPVSFKAFLDLPSLNIATNRKKWTASQLADVQRYEGIPVSVVGYLVAVKKQFGGGGETTNCHFSTEPFVDSHVALVEKPGQGEEKAIVVEPTPRAYAKHPSWSWTNLRKLDDSPDPVRISGWTLMDPVHKGHLGKYRATLWEIHPITKIEVFKNGVWKEW